MYGDRECGSMAATEVAAAAPRVLRSLFNETAEAIVGDVDDMNKGRQQRAACQDEWTTQTHIASGLLPLQWLMCRTLLILSRTIMVLKLHFRTGESCHAAPQPVELAAPHLAPSDAVMSRQPLQDPAAHCH